MTLFYLKLKYALVLSVGLEPTLRTNLVLTVYKTAFLPLEDESINMAPLPGLEPGMTA